MANDLDVSIGRDVINFGGPIPVIDGIYQMTDDPNIDEDSENPEWIGYDSIADTYDRRSAPLDLRVRLAEAVLATDPGERAVVLDVGAGTGLWSVPFAKAGARVIAVDISNRMLARLRASADEIGVDVVACRANALELPIDDNSIEFVSVSALLHLIRNPERVVKEIQRVLQRSLSSTNRSPAPIGLLQSGQQTLGAQRQTTEHRNSRGYTAWLPGKLISQNGNQ